MLSLLRPGGLLRPSPKPEASIRDIISCSALLSFHYRLSASRCESPTSGKHFHFPLSLFMAFRLNSHFSFDLNFYSLSLSRRFAGKWKALLQRIRISNLALPRRSSSTVSHLSLAQLFDIIGIHLFEVKSRTFVYIFADLRNHLHFRSDKKRSSFFNVTASSSGELDQKKKWRVRYFWRRFSS